MYCKALSDIEKATLGVSHIASITANDLTTATANTEQVLNLMAIPTDAFIEKVEARLIVPFEDVSDAALDSVTIDIGHTDNDDEWVAAAELCKNGTEITQPKYSNTAVGPFAASKYVTATFAATAGKLLSNVDKGEIQILLRLCDFKPVHDGQPTTAMTK